jgi:hypothetical protein
MPRGGKRPNSGPEKGTKYAPTIAKEQARDALRQIVLRDMEGLVTAQLANAKGISHFFLRDESGRFVKIEDAKKIEHALNSGDKDSYYWIFTKDPSIQAFTDLMNRALDKPAEQEFQVKLTADGELLARLDAGRQRARE